MVGSLQGSRYGVGGRLVVVLLCACCCLAAVTGAVAASSPDGAGSAATPRLGTRPTAASADHPLAVATESVSQSPPGTTNNSTIQQRRPESVAEDGDAAELKRWLRGRLAGRLRGSTIQLSQGQYERADAALGDEYKQYLGQYVDVAGETESTRDDRIAQNLTRARRAQQEYVSTVRSYRTLAERYRAARAAGNESKARRIARRMETLSRRASRTGTTLTRTYGNLSGSTGTDFTETRDAVSQTTQNVSEQQATIRKQVFVQPTLDVRAANATASFATPLTVRGRLALPPNASNVSLPDEIAVRVGAVRLRTTLADDGTFAVEYRPVVAPTGNRTLAVRYVPRNGSAFLGANDTVSTRIEGVTPTVRVRDATGTARFDDRVRTRGRVTVDGTPVANAPVVVALANRSLSRVRTNATGWFVTNASLPASPAPGARSLAITAGTDGRAVAPATVERSLRVRSTSTALELHVTPQGGGERVVVSGRLTARDGVPIADRTIALRVGGETVRTVRTDATGNVTATLSAVPPGETVTVTARFGGAGNLRAARESATARLGSGADETTGPWWTSLPLPAIAGLLVLLALVGGAAIVSRRRGEATTTDDEPSTTTDAAEDDGTTAPSTSVADRLAALLDDDSATRDDAVVAIYAALRGPLTDRYDLDPAATHWEFVQGLATARDALARPATDLARAYERAAFAADSLDAATRDRAVDAARDLLAALDDGDDSPDAVAIEDGGSDSDHVPTDHEPGGD